MIEAKVYSTDGQQVDTVQIDEAVLGGHVRHKLIHEAVLMYQSNLRQGNACTKHRGEIAGSKKKLFRQKGTGRARRGNRRTNVLKGGGSAFSPKPRNWYYRMPKKMVRLATRSALLSKFLDDEAIVVDSLSFDEPKTKKMAGIFDNLGIDESVLIATGERDENVYKSARNIQKVQVLPVDDLNALALIKQRRLLITREALEKVTAAQ